MRIIILLITFFISSIAFSHDEEFSNWMNHTGLDNYLFVLNNGDKETSFFEKGHRITALEGRWKNNQVEYRITYGDTPKDSAHWWWWWMNQPYDSFVKKLEKYEKEGAKLVYSQSFLMPDGTARYQGVWHKVDD
jgi:hypothetical protein